MPSHTDMCSHSINTKAAFLILQQGAKHVNDNGKLISLGSALLAAYARSKAPLEDFTRALCKELADRGVSVNTTSSIAPLYMKKQSRGLSVISDWDLGAFQSRQFVALSFVLPTEEEQPRHIFQPLLGTSLRSHKLLSATPRHEQKIIDTNELNDMEAEFSLYCKTERQAAVCVSKSAIGANYLSWHTFMLTSRQGPWSWISYSTTRL